MTRITLQDGQIVLRDGKIGTEQACCCKEGDETDECQGPCETDNDCSENCKCNDGECAPKDPKDCRDCEKACCVFIQGRNTCENGSSGNEGWGSQFGFPLWVNTIDGVNYSIIVIVGECSSEDGTTPVFIESLVSVAGEFPASKAHQWFDAILEVGPDGCPTGIVFGNMTVACDGGSGCGSGTPLDPQISFFCS
jgi:hypothetical protein